MHTPSGRRTRKSPKMVREHGYPCSWPHIDTAKEGRGRQARERSRRGMANHAKPLDARIFTEYASLMEITILRRRAGRRGSEVHKCADNALYRRLA